MVPWNEFTVSHQVITASCWHLESSLAHHHRWVMSCASKTVHHQQTFVQRLQWSNRIHTNERWNVTDEHFRETSPDAAAHLIHLCLWGSLTFQVQLLCYLKWTFSHTWPWNQRQVLRFQGTDVENLYYISNLTPSSSDWNHWFQWWGQDICQDISSFAFVRPLNLIRLAEIPLNIMFLWTTVGGLIPSPLILSPWKLHERKCRCVGEGHDMLRYLTLVTD